MNIIDGDGHINEDSQGIGKHLPKEIFEDERISRISDRWFPPLDHFHAFNGRTPKGSFQRVGPDGWLRFLDEVGIDTTVLYPTLGLSFGNVFHLDWSIALARAYNDWLYETYLNKSARFKGMALIPMQEPEAAAEELRRAVEKLGFCGAMLAFNWTQGSSGRERLLASIQRSRPFSGARWEFMVELTEEWGLIISMSTRRLERSAIRWVC